MRRLSFRNLPIRQKLTCGAMLVSSVALLLTCGAFLTYDYMTFRNTKAQRLSSIAQIIGFNSTSALLFNDPGSAETTLSALRTTGAVACAGIYGKDGQRFAAYRRDQNAPCSALDRIEAIPGEMYQFSGDHLAMFSPIDSDGERIGTVYIESDLQELHARARRFLAIAVVVLALAVVVVFFISHRIQRFISEPILQLSAAARTISLHKNYSVRVPRGSDDELGLLVNTFNEMLAQVEQRDAELHRAGEELEQRVLDRTADLAAANAELQAFTYSVSHDLRAPLRHIDGFSRILIDEHSSKLDAPALHLLRRVREGATHMGQLVDDLLNLSRVSRQELRVQVTGLNSIVEGVVASLAAETKERVIDWRIGRLPFVECDPGLMKQVFSNLLANAVKFTRVRERAVIQVDKKTENGETAVFVRDNGVGFSLKYADKLFGVFQRLHRAEDFEGTGVGLATVQRIIGKHGGRVWAEAELDQGATFYFTMSANQAALAEKSNPSRGAECLTTP